MFTVLEWTGSTLGLIDDYILSARFSSFSLPSSTQYESRLNQQRERSNLASGRSD